MSKRIALVEDDIAIRDNYRAALTKQGYEVLCYEVAYDFRDVVDLNDLDISQAVLQGVTLQLGIRFN